MKMKSMGSRQRVNIYIPTVHIGLKLVLAIFSVLWNHIESRYYGIPLRKRVRHISYTRPILIKEKILEISFFATTSIFSFQLMIVTRISHIFTE